MCIRAIDYCPPVDITFGDFLRGVVTADLDYRPGDKSGFRIVFIESFREWGIYPRGVSSMGLDALGVAWRRRRCCGRCHERGQAGRMTRRTSGHT